MIALQEIEHLIKLAIYSPFINKEKPVSIMLIAPSEHGKSELLKKFAFINSIFIGTEFTTFTFSEFALQHYPKKKTIIIPDFLRLTKRKQSTSANALSIISAITEEGWIGKLPLGQIVDKPITANVITALTKDELEDKRHKWAKTGFLSRFMPVSYSYKEDTKKRIRGYIKDRIYKTDENATFELPLYITDISLPKEIADKIEKITLNISKEENILGFRLERQLQTLAMGNALMSRRTMTTNDDYLMIEKLSRFINYKFLKL